MAEAAGGMQIDDPGLARSLGVAVRHCHDAGLLQAEHVVDALAADQGVDQRQFGGTGIAEDVLDALGLQGFEQHVGAEAPVGWGGGHGRALLSSDVGQPGRLDYRQFPIAGWPARCFGSLRIGSRTVRGSRHLHRLAGCVVPNAVRRMFVEGTSGMAAIVGQIGVCLKNRPVPRADCRLGSKLLARTSRAGRHRDPGRRAAVRCCDWTTTAAHFPKLAGCRGPPLRQWCRRSRRGVTSNATGRAPMPTSIRLRRATRVSSMRRDEAGRRHRRDAVA